MKTTFLVAAILCAFAVFTVAADPPATQPSAPATTQKAMPADELLMQMLKPPGGGAKPLEPVKEAPTIDVTVVTAITPNAPAVHVLREGTFLVDRTGRLTRSTDGQAIEFTFDADGKTLTDPPVVILPNLKLMAMEKAVASANRDLRFRITGMVTEYRGRNYILLEKVVIIPEITQQF